MRSTPRRAVGALLAIATTAAVGTGVAHAQMIGPPAMRYTLNDGSSLVGSAVAEDAETITVQTAIGLVRLRRATIVSIDLPGARSLPPSPAAYPVQIVTPPPQVTSVQPEPTRRRGGGETLRAGALILGGAWFITALAASIALELKDPNALWGFVPVVGPVFWGIAGGRSAGLGFAILDTILQGAGALAVLTGAILLATEDAPRKVTFLPAVDGRGWRFALVGRF